MWRLFPVSILLAGVLIGGAGAETLFVDDFEAPWMYNVDGVEGTGWDGFIGMDLAEEPLVNASLLIEGQLYIQSNGSAWAPPWDALGPYLYKIVEGNFTATVKVTDYAGTPDELVYHNNCGLMARNVEDADAGDGEDWISVDYFPIWNCGNMVRMADDGARTEPCNNGVAWDVRPYLQLERRGNTFYCRVSADGENWEPLCDPFVRDDFDGLPVQVGLFHSVYNSVDGHAAFDDFVIARITTFKAILKSPDDGAVGVVDPVLEWIAGDTAVAHEVFLGTDPNALESMGIQTETSYAVEQVENAVTYYWRIDEIEEDGTAHEGDVWSFEAAVPLATTMFPVVEDFDTAHDFLADGVEGTFWDGLVGVGINETASAVTTADPNRAGQLYLESNGSTWDGPWNPLGPYLYKVVEGDFRATVKVTDYAGTPDEWVYHNNCGLMARNVEDSDAGDGEDWISVDYFPIWSCGNMVRMGDDGARTEPCNNRLAWEAHPYLQLERQGNTFYCRVSADGENWEQLCDPFVRDDFNDVPVQVGLFHAVYNTVDGYAAFDDFVLETRKFQDDFEAPHDYVADGLAVTAFDGLAGDINDVNAVVDASLSRQGLLYIESAVGSTWSEPWEPLGPFLYKVVAGNFVATVKVAEYAGDPDNVVFHNNCGLMARNAEDAHAGDGEDWVSIDYFPIWSCGNFVRSADDGARRENCHNGLQWSLHPYLQIERAGNTFHLRVSPDGETWEEMACSPLEREDFNGLPVQVGVFHAVYDPASTGYAAFDDLSIETNE
jgi:hypothetical protein